MSDRQLKVDNFIILKMSASLRRQVWNAYRHRQLRIDIRVLHGEWQTSTKTPVTVEMIDDPEQPHDPFQLLFGGEGFGQDFATMETHLKACTCCDTNDSVGFNFLVRM